MKNNGKANSVPDFNELMAQLSKDAERNCQRAKMLLDATIAQCSRMEYQTLLKTPRPKDGKVKIPQQLIATFYIN